MLPSSRRAWLYLALVATYACRTPEPEKELALSSLEAYWAVDSTAGETVYLAPVVRFELANRAATEPIETTATFHRKGEGASWGSAFERLSAPPKPLRVGQAQVVTLKSDGRYYTSGAPESIFTHAQFKDATVEVFVRVGSSPWTRMAAADVERRIGSKTLAAPPSASPAP